MSAGLNMDLHYIDELYCYYEALHAYGVQVDVIGTDAALDEYRIVIAPTLYMVKPGVAGRLTTFTENGGTLVVSIYSGMADENENVTQNGYPGELRELCGLWTEEFDSLPAGEYNHFTWNGTRYTVQS
jgi:beta-galactosidase